MTGVPAAAPQRKRILAWASLIGLAALTILLIGVDPAWAAEEKTAFQKYWALGWRIVNFLILAILIFKLAKDPAKKFFSEKRQEAEATLDELNQAKEAAQAELDELKDKLDKADTEIESLVEQLTETASRNRDRILQEAEVQAEEIVSQAKVAAETELNRAVDELKAESTRMIIARAGEMLKEAMTPDDHQNLIDEALTRMDASKAA